MVGAGVLLLLPYVSRGLTSMHWFAARALLGRFRTDALEAQVASLAESRGAAHAAEGHSLRRLERDIHDGPQQRLVRLQMDLAAAERQLDTDPDKARGLIAEAMQQSKDALEELRALSRGFAPPLASGPRPGCRPRIGCCAQLDSDDCGQRAAGRCGVARRDRAQCLLRGDRSDGQCRQALGSQPGDSSGVDAGRATHLAGPRRKR